MWEHMVLFVGTGTSRDMLQQKLDNASSDDWELVSVAIHVADKGDYPLYPERSYYPEGFHLFFKRPAEE